MKRNIDCTLCELHKSVRKTKCVWGVGSLKAKVAIIGDAPGVVEDLQGQPYVGKSGQMLDHILSALGVKRDDIYLTLTLKCRPPDGELPKSTKTLNEYWEACHPYLDEELGHLKKLKSIVLMGNVPLKLLTDEKKGVTRLEGMVVGQYKTATVYSSFQPSYILRSPSKECCLARVIASACLNAGMKLNVQPFTMFPYELRG